MRSHDLANLGRRNQPNFKDLVQGVKDFGVAGVKELKEEVERTKGRDGAFCAVLPARLQRTTNAHTHSTVPQLSVVYDKIREEAPGPTLASDDEPSSESEASEYEDEPAPAPPALPLIEGGPAPPPAPAAPRRKKVKQPKVKPLDALKGDFLPPLPAKHSYKQTPVRHIAPLLSSPELELTARLHEQVYPQSRIPPAIPQASTFPTQQTPSALAMRHLSTLRSRLNDSQLVASSLRNLIRKTSARATSGTEGAMILGDQQEGGATADNDNDDVVDYEGEWYGGRGGPGVKRSVLVMRVGEEGKVDLEGWGSGNGREEEGRDGMAFMKSAEGWSDAGRVGGAGKRRKWRV